MKVEHAAYYALDVDAAPVGTSGRCVRLGGMAGCDRTGTVATRG